MKNRDWQKIGDGKVQFADYEPLANYLWVKFDTGHIDKYYCVLEGDLVGLKESAKKSSAAADKFFFNLIKNKIRIPIFDPYSEGL